MLYKLKKKLFKKYTIGFTYEKLSYNTILPPVEVQTYIVIKIKDEIRLIKYRKIYTSQSYYQLLEVLHAKGYKEMEEFI